MSNDDGAEEFVLPTDAGRSSYSCERAATELEDNRTAWLAGCAKDNVLSNDGGAEEVVLAADAGRSGYLCVFAGTS